MSGSSDPGPTIERAPTRDRIASIDIMRGLIIVLMMLDHVRERFYMHTRTGDPMFDTVEPDLFFTRLLPHLCAPLFIFLAGVSAWLYAHPPGREPRSPSAFLFKRGLVIIGIEIVLYYLVWADSYPDYLFLQVLWAIGLVMIALSVAVRLPFILIGALGFVIVLGHNLLTPIDFDPGDILFVPWAILHDGGTLANINGFKISLSYPALPWFGVILLGYFSGPLYGPMMTRLKRRKALIGIGVASLTLLLVLRGFNIYGETEPWAIQESAIRTVMDFLNYTKYPPSLNFILLTLGFGMIALALFETREKPGRALSALETVGSVPMFVYIVHLYVLLAAYWILYPIFGATHEITRIGGETVGRFGLPNVASIWLGTLILTAIMYPLTKVFASYKHHEKRNKPWLSYF